MLSSSALAVLLAVLSLSAPVQVQAHPGDDHTDLVRRADFFRATAASLANCVTSPAYLAVRDAAIKRRSNYLSSLRSRAASKNPLIRKAALIDETNHKSNLTNVNLETDPAILFGTLPQAVLAPEVIEGPYFVSGEHIRNSIAEDQIGLPVYIDLQFFDSQTCEPIPALYVNLWQANTTGVYSGVIASLNGDPNDRSNLFNTNHRGIYPTDDDGVVQFETTFPGHYIGRTTHFHITTGSGGVVLPNNTYANATYSHVGQLYFDQDLINLVESRPEYSQNTQELTLNKDDFLLLRLPEGTDPFLTYAFINDDIDNGILAWASMAINTTQVVRVTSAVFYAGNNTVGERFESPVPSSPSASPKPRQELVEDSTVFALSESSAATRSIFTASSVIAVLAASLYQWIL